MYFVIVSLAKISRDVISLTVWGTQTLVYPLSRARAIILLKFATNTDEIKIILLPSVAEEMLSAAIKFSWVEYKASNEVTISRISLLTARYIYKCFTELFVPKFLPREFLNKIHRGAWLELFAIILVERYKEEYRRVWLHYLQVYYIRR